MQLSTYRNIFFAIVMSLVLVLAACGGNEAKEEAAPNENEEPKQEENAAEEETSDVRVIEHALGTTEIEGTPQRVVTLYQGANDAAVALGITPVGIVDAWAEDPVYDYLKEELSGVPSVGKETQPNLEEIAKLNPDVIIASKLRHEEVYPQLQEIAPTVAHETVFEFNETVDLMGQALNKQEEANELIAEWDNRVADLQTKLEEKLGDEWPLEVSILNFRADHARIYFTGFAGSILEEVGFERPENQQEDVWGIKLTDKEAITEMNADVFYIFMNEDEAVQKTYEEWTSHPLWTNLDAVQKDQVYMVDEIIWNMAGGYKAANLMLDDIYDRFELEK